MIPAASLLLSALGGIIRPRGVGSGDHTPNPGSIDQEGEFAAALAKAQSGDMATNAPVSIAKGLELKLSASQLSRLSGAADRAEAQGIGRAIVLMDGQALTLDVASRTITGLADLSATSVHGAEAVITVAPETDQHAALLGPPSAGAAALANPSLLKSLSTPSGAIQPALAGDDH